MLQATLDDLHVFQATLDDKPRMLREAIAPQFAEQMELTEVNLWMSRLPTNLTVQSGLHFDAAENLVRNVLPLVLDCGPAVIGWVAAGAAGG